MRPKVGLRLTDFLLPLFLILLVISLLLEVAVVGNQDLVFGKLEPVAVAVAYLQITLQFHLELYTPLQSVLVELLVQLVLVQAVVIHLL
jgi:hypothetical protein